MIHDTGNAEICHSVGLIYFLDYVNSKINQESRAHEPQK